MANLEIYSPVPVAVDVRTAKPSAAFERDSLEGASVAIINNGWGSIEELATMLEKELRDTYGVANVQYFLNPDKGHPAPESFIAEVVRRNSAAIVELGKCGACTAWSCDTSLRLEAAGIRA